MAKPLPNTLTAPIMGYDEAGLLGAPTYWPWDEKFYVNGVEYVNFCKPFSYEIVYKGTNLLVDFVSLDAINGVMQLHPDTNSPLGVSVLTLRTQLYIFPSFTVINYVDFEVTVTECIPTLLSNGIALKDKYTKWGYGEAYYDVSLLLSMFTMDPKCGYPITFDAYCHDEQNNLTVLTEVSEVAWFPSSKVFAYSKCGPDSDPFDPECAGTPYTKVVPIRLIARAGLYTIVEAAPEHWIDFNIIFEPDCTKDTIYFDIPHDYGQISYFLTSPLATQKVMNPIYIQSIPECPVLCDLFENLVKWDASNPDTIVSAFDQITGKITLNSNDITKDGSQTLLVMECVSLESDIVSSIGEPDKRDGCDFEINLFDACSLTTIQPP